jgi:hypothetical protein
MKCKIKFPNSNIFLSIMVSSINETDVTTGIFK